MFEMKRSQRKKYTLASSILQPQGKADSDYQQYRQLKNAAKFNKSCKMRF